jgi:hypothetical protein
MDLIVIQRKEVTENGWRFVVEVGTQGEYRVGFAVLVDRKYWQQLTLEKFLPERLIKETFIFLLAKETTKTALLRQLGNSFDLRDLPDRYYSYERRMKMALFSTEYPM